MATDRLAAPRIAGAERVLLALVTALMVVGCVAQAPLDKTGTRVLRLQLASIENLNSNRQTVAFERFVDSLKRRSDGQLVATVELNRGNGAVQAETEIVEAVMNGDLDGAVPSTRALSRAGLRGFEPIEAPFLLRSYDAQRALVGGPGADTLLASLDGSPVVGLGLAVGPLRRPFAVSKPLLDASDWRGTTFRSLNSPVQDATVRALGGTPVHAGWDYPALIHAGELEGVESDVAQIAVNGQGHLVPELVTNEVLWPRMFVILINRSRFDALSEEQRRWLREAAAEAVQASVDADYDERSAAVSLCQQGVRFTAATPSQLGGLRRLVQPIHDALAADPATRESWRVVAAEARGKPGLDVVETPDGCRQR